MSLLIGTTEGAFRLGDHDPVIDGRRINHVARSEDGWWAVDDGGDVHHNGEVVGKLPGEAKAHCVQPTHETIWIGSDAGRLFGIDHGVLTEDEFFATAPGRDTWYTPWGAPADVRSMTLDAAHTLYINVHVGGILRYDNTGVVPTLDIDADVHQVSAHPTQKGVVFAATAHGLAQSHNGHDFDFRTEGLHSPYCRAVAVLEDRLLLSASTGPRTTDGRLYVGDLWEGALNPVTSGLPERFEGNLNTHCITVHDNGVFIGFGHTVWRSDDRGDNWEAVADGVPTITCVA